MSDVLKYFQWVKCGVSAPFFKLSLAVILLVITATYTESKWPKKRNQPVSGGCVLGGCV